MNGRLNKGLDADKTNRGAQNPEARLNEFFAAYREACPVPEASADFMPQLWARIEGRQQLSAVFAWRRWAQAFLSLAAAMCLLIMILQVVPHSTPVYLQSSYVDQLIDDDQPEVYLSREVAAVETGPGTSQLDESLRPPRHSGEGGK